MEDMKEQYALMVEELELPEDELDEMLGTSGSALFAFHVIPLSLLTRAEPNSLLQTNFANHARSVSATPNRMRIARCRTWSLAT